MKEDDRPYYAERALAERYLSEAPLDEHSRFVHLELALRYEALAHDREFDPAKLTAERAQAKLRALRQTGGPTENGQLVKND